MWKKDLGKGGTEHGQGAAEGKRVLGLSAVRAFLSSRNWGPELQRTCCLESRRVRYRFQEEEWEEGKSWLASLLQGTCETCGTCEKSALGQQGQPYDGAQGSRLIQFSAMGKHMAQLKHWDGEEHKQKRRKSLPVFHHDIQLP